MKKISALILSIAVLLSALLIPASADGGYEVRGFWSMDGYESGDVIDSALSIVHSYGTAESVQLSNPVYGTAVKFTNDNSAVGKVQNAFFRFPSKATATGAASSEKLKAELSFDVCGYNLIAKNKGLFVIPFTYLPSVQANLVSIAINKNGVMTVGGKTVDGVYPVEEMMNIKVVFYMPTADRNDTIVTGIYVNGKLADAAETIYPIKLESASASSINALRVYVSNARDGDSDLDYGFYLDNLSVIRYRDEDGTMPSPAADKSALAAAAANAQKCLDDASASESKLAALSEALSEAVDVYKNPQASESEVSAANETLLERIRECGGSTGPVSGSFTRFEDFENPDAQSEFNVSLMNGIASYENISSNAYEKNAFNFRANTSVVGKSQYADFKLGDYSTPFEDGEPNTFFEASADISSYNMSMYSKNYYMRLADSSANATLAEIYVIKGVTANINIYEGSTVKTVPIKTGLDPSKMYNFRIVVRVTDENGNAAPQLCGVYINGELCDGETSVYPTAITAGTKIDSVRLALSNFKSTDTIADMQYGIYADNVTATRFYSEKGAPELKTKSDLINAIRTFDSEAEKKSQSGLYTSDQKKRALAMINEGSEVLHSREALPEEIDAMCRELDILRKKLGIQKGKAVEMLDPETDAASLAGRSGVNVSAQLISAENAAESKYTVAACLYIDDDSDTGGRLCAIRADDVALNSDDYAKCSFAFDLTNFSEEEKEKMYIRIYAFEDIENAEADAELIKTLYKTDEPAGENTEKMRLSSSLSVYPEYNGSDRHTAVVSGGKKNESVILLVAKKGAVPAADNISESVMFLAAVAADGSGRAAFRISSLENGEYTAIVNRGGQNKATMESFTAADKETAKEAFDELMKNPSAENLNMAKPLIGIDPEVLGKAESAGVDSAAAAAELLKKQAFDFENCNEFVSEYLNILNMLSGFKTAENADAVKLLLEKYGSRIDGISAYNALSSSEKHSAESYICDKRSSVESVSALEALVSSAVKKAGESGSSGSGGGGGGSKSGQIPSGDVVMQPPVTVPGSSGITANLAFSDMDGCAWAAEAVSFLVRSGAVSGKSQSAFAPYDNVTREEFVKMILKAFSYDIQSGECAFADVDKKAWYADYIFSAVSGGIINGIGADCFGIGRDVTREDACVIIARILGNKNAAFTENGEYIPFTDDTYISDYARSSVEGLAASGIVNGAPDNSFSPKSGCTRAEAAKMIYEAYSFMAGKGSESVNG